MGAYRDYYDGDQACEAYVATPAGSGPWPVVLVIPTIRGASVAERERADQWAAEGRIGIVVDVYGKDTRGADAAGNAALMNAFLADRALLRRRLLAAVAFAQTVAGADASRIAAIGYCFGGLCALDIARSGTDAVLGVVSVHGIFQPSGLPQEPIGAKILVCHGYADPHATPPALLALAEELTAAKADWQVHAYGNVVHGFANKGHDRPESGVRYDAVADRRSSAAIRAFLAELFDG